MREDQPWEYWSRTALARSLDLPPALGARLAEHVPPPGLQALLRAVGSGRPLQLHLRL
jgi:hypothetical protein